MTKTLRQAFPSSLLVAALGLGLFVVVYYLPALTSEAEDLLNLDNTVNRLNEAYGPSYIYGPYLSNDPDFYADWEKSRELVRRFVLPLWYGGSEVDQNLRVNYLAGRINPAVVPPGTNPVRFCGMPCPNDLGGRAVVAEGTAPVLYPLSLIYYLTPNKPLPAHSYQQATPAKGLAFFLLVHLWLCGFGLVLLVRKWLPGRGRYVGLIVILILLMPLGGLRPDWLAAAAWLPLGLWVLSWPGWSGRLLFAPIAGLILLAVDWPIALGLIGGLVILSIAQEAFWSKGGFKSAVNLLAVLLLMTLLGVGIAGPQLFPRLVSRFGAAPALDYVPAASNTGIELHLLQPDAAEKIVRVIDNTVDANQPHFPKPTIGYSPARFGPNGRAEIEIDLVVPPGSGPFSVIRPERYAEGWVASLDEPNNLIATPQGYREKPGNRGQTRDLKVEATPQGWQSIQIVPPAEGGTYLLRVRYNPMAFTLGLYATFLALAAMTLGFGMLAWRRFYREDETNHPIRRVAKNSITPLFAQLVGKGLDFGFALFSLRLLGPEGNGRYTIAVTTWLILATLTDLGLETLVTREVARNRSFEYANRHFFTMFFTKIGTSLLSFPVALLWIGGFSLTGNMGNDTGWAILLLLLGFLPGSLSSTMTALFRAYEKYEYLAAIQILTAIIRVPLGLGALLAGWGVIGLAGSSVVVNFITVLALGTLFRREIFQPRLKGAFDFRLARTLVSLSYPLVLNSLLNNILFKSDALLLGAIRSEAEVGLYNSAYKFIDAVLIIPSALTLALFPLLASYAASSLDELKRTYLEGLRLLLIIGLPISAGTVFVAHDLIGALGGSLYLPGGAICLQILIWFLPFSYVNGLTQYVLIALNKQRLITVALVVTAVANIGLNLLFIPFFGYIAASAMTIVSELFMLVPFCWLARRELGQLPFWKISWRPLLASTLMILGLLALTVGLGLTHFFIVVPVGGFIYLTTLLATRTFTAHDLRLLKKIVAKG